MPSPPSYGCCTRVNFVLKKHLLFQMNLSNSGLKNRSIKEYWLIFTVLKFPLGLQFSHNLTKFKIIKYISTIYIMTTTCTYLQQLTQVSDVAHGPLVKYMVAVPHYLPFLMGGAMVLGKLPVPGRPTNWIIVGKERTGLAVGAGGVLWTFFSHIYHFTSFSLSLGDDLI